MVLYKKNLMCIDFSSNYTKSFFTFVKDITGDSLFNVAGLDKEKINSKMFENSLKERKDFPNRIRSVKVNGMLDRVEKHEVAMEYCQRRNLFKDFRNTFNIRYMPSGKINTTYFGNRICIPIEENGKTVSMEGRDVTGKSRAKVLYPKGAYVSTLFNIDNLKRNKTLVVVEGIMDIPKFWKFFTKNVTTTFGIMITTNQKKLLSEFDDIILFPDGDEAGENMIESFEDFFNKEFQVAHLPGKDPGEASIKDIDSVLSDPINSTKWFLEKSGLFEKRNEKESFYDV